MRLQENSGGFLGLKYVSVSRDRLLEGWVVGLTLSAAALCGGLLAAGYRIHHPAAVAVLAALALAADYGSIRISPLV